jgi:hypothetical protein
MSPSIVEANSETIDPSLRGFRITDLITGRIFAAASLYAALDCADGRALTGPAEVHAFSLISCKLIVDKRIIKSERLARPSLALIATRQSTNS